MKIKVSSPPVMNGGKYDRERLNAWLNELVLAVNMGFSNISYDNLNKELREPLERMMNTKDV